MKKVLDASALLSGRQFDGELYTVPSVEGELRRHGLTPALEAFLEAHVRRLSPGPDSERIVRRTSERTGDVRRLSRTDGELLALALELAANIVTDDYSIQNVAKALHVDYEPVLTRGIREQWTWTYRCVGCGGTWPEWHGECPTCGQALRTVRLRPTPGTQ